MISVDITELFLWLFAPLMSGGKKGHAPLKKSVAFSRRFV